ADAGVVDQGVDGVRLPADERLAQFVDEAGEASDVAGIELQGDGTAAKGFHLGHRGPGGVAVGQVGQDDVVPVAGERACGGAAQAAAAAGDEGDGGGGGGCVHGAGSSGGRARVAPWESRYWVTLWR